MGRSGSRPCPTVSQWGRAQPPEACDTNVATALICASLNRPLNEGITPAPLVTSDVTVATSTPAPSSLGPTLPLVPAADSVWQEPQLSVNTCLPSGAAAGWLG